MLLSLLVLLGTSWNPPSPETRPNVLVIVLDDVGAGDVAGMPSIDWLASQGTSYTRAYAFPVCSPTRFAALTGALPRRAGIGDIINAYDNSDEPSPAPARSWTFLPELLKVRGYSTCMVGKWHLGDGRLAGVLDRATTGWFVQGFDEGRAVNPNSVALGGGNPLVTGYYGWHSSTDGNLVVSRSYATDAQADALVDWWEQRAGSKLAWLAFSAAHSPYDTPPGYAEGVTTREKYLAVLSYADARLADVLARVSLANTYVLLFGDNGTPDEARPEGTPSGHWKGGTLEGGVKVPFILAGPGIPVGTSSRLVSVVDVAPTLCDLLGVEAKFLDGVSILSPFPRTWVFTERYDCPGGAQVFPEGYDDQAVIETVFKLRRVDADGAGPGGTVDLAYHLGVDPHELSPQDPSTLPPAVRNRLYSRLATLPPREP